MPRTLTAIEQDITTAYRSMMEYREAGEPVLAECRERWMNFKLDELSALLAVTHGVVECDGSPV